MDIQKPDVKAISVFLEENRGSLSDAEFVTRYIAGLTQSLQADKRLYRSFGGFWWPLKRILLATSQSDILEMGDSYNTELNQQFSYANDALTVCAAYLTQQENIENGYLYASKHIYATDTHEPIEIVIEDPAIELLILADSF